MDKKDEREIRRKFDNKKFKLKIPMAIHIPLEICDKCQHHCENYGKDHSKLNKNRNKIGKYVHEVCAMPVIMYNNPHEMQDILGLILAEPSDRTTGHTLITFIIITDSNEGNLILSVVDWEMEERWIDELEKTGKIKYFFDIVKSRK